MLALAVFMGYNMFGQEIISICPEYGSTYISFLVSSYTYQLFSIALRLYCIIISSGMIILEDNNFILFHGGSKIKIDVAVHELRLWG